MDMPRRSSALPFTICWLSAGENPNDSSETFNMAYLAIRGSGAVNGVSRLHGKVSQSPLSVSVSALAGGRNPGRPRDQRSPYADLGLGSGRRFVDGSLW